MLRLKGLLFFPLLVFELSLDVLNEAEGAFLGESSILCRGFSSEKSNCLLTGLCTGGCDPSRMGVPLFRFRDGEDIGPTDRAMDLRGDEFRCVFLGDVARGGRLIMAFRALLTRSVGSGIAPAVIWTINKKGFPGLHSWRRLTLVSVHTIVRRVCVVWRYAIGSVQRFRW